MMIAIKVQCGCGQRYAFDVEPVAGQMPGSVSCPVCGADGTAAANAAILQQAPQQVAAPQPVRIGVGAVSSPPPTRVSPTQQPSTVRVAPALAAHSSAHAPSAPGPAANHPGGPVRLPGQMNPEQALVEAKAKISWGDSPEDVIKFLLMQGFSHVDAKAKVDMFFEERAAAIRKNGIRKVFIGIGLIVLAAVVCVGVLVVEFLPFRLQILGALLAVACWGLWLIIKGAIMFFAPRSEPGDVSEQ